MKVLHILWLVEEGGENTGFDGVGHGQLVPGKLV